MNKLLDQLSHFLGDRPGLLPLIGILLIVLNLFLQFLPANWFSETNLLLHIGLIVSLLGMLLIRPLR